MTPAILAQEQLDAYNAHDLERFVAVYSEDVLVFRMPSHEPTIQGLEAFREAYRKRLQTPGLRAEVVSRMVIGDKVIDHERVFTDLSDPVEVGVVYAVERGKISRVWFFAAHDAT